MEPFRRVLGVVAPLDRPDVDTDQIIPKQFLKRIERTGYGPFLFYDWRYLDDGVTEDESDHAHREAMRAFDQFERDLQDKGRAILETAVNFPPPISRRWSTALALLCIRHSSPPGSGCGWRRKGEVMPLR